MIALSDKKSIKAVFFDLYGTLLDYGDMEVAGKVWVNSFYKLIGEQNNLPIETIKEICERILTDDYDLGAKDSLTTYEAKIKFHFKKVGVEFSREKLKYIADETVGSWQQYIFLYKDAIEVLQKLKQSKKLVLISNFDHTPHVKKVLQQNNLNQFFDLILISDEVGINKPDKRIFDIALKKFDLSPEEVVMVGDSYKDDILGARSVNIIPVLIKLNHGLHAHNKQDSNDEIITINSLSELIPILSK